MRALLERVDVRARSNLAARLRKAGLKVTAQRLGAFEALKGSRSHLTVEELHRALRRRLPGISREAARFDPTSEPYDHAVCVRCRRIIDIWDLALRKVKLPRTLAARWG